MRPANIITAIADILLGFSAAVAATAMPLYNNPFPCYLLWLIAATIGLYGGGVVLNDVFDATLDAIERPERPIPSGIVPLKHAILLGSTLLLLGTIAAFQASFMSGIIAICISALVIAYDAFSKHQTVLGPVNMGLCRGANLLLGVSAIPSLVAEFWFLAIIPITYIAAITMISRGEVHGGNKNMLSWAIVLYVLVIAGITMLALLPYYSLLPGIPFLLLFLYLTLPNLYKAFRQPGAMEIRKAVKSCVIALIVLDASIAAGFSGLFYGMIVLCLLPISIIVSKVFSVT